MTLTEAESGRRQESVVWTSGWRLWVLVLSPYALIQLWHEVAPGLFPDWLSVVPESSVIPFRDWANSFLGYLRNDDLLGLFNFRDFSRTVSGWLSTPLDVSEQLLIAGGGPLGIGAAPWVLMFTTFAVLGHFLGGWRLAALGAGTMLYLAVFDAWEDSMITLSIVLVCAPLAMLIGTALGLLAARSRAFEAVLIPILNVQQSLPHFSYLVPIAVFVGVGDEAGAIATILFALPPMARLTILGLRSVSVEIREAGLMAGCTRRQMLWKVELPAARPSLLVGVNQVIMQCFGMTVLASFVGTRGLGLPLLNFLNATRIGDALELGVAIVLLAVMLDRLSQVAGARRPEHRPEGLTVWQVHTHLLVFAGIAVAGVILAQVSDWFRVLPETWTVDTSDWWDSLVNWITREFRGPLEGFREFMVLDVLFPLRDAFQSLPWIGLVALVAAVGWRFGGWRLAAMVASFVGYLAFSGFWVESMETMYLVVAALILSFVIGVPLGIFAASSDRRTAAMQVVLDTFQVLPSFIYLIPVVMLFRVGPVAGLFAILVYATVPAVRYTMLGLRSVPEDVIEAAQT